MTDLNVEQPKINRVDTLEKPIQKIDNKKIIYRTTYKKGHMIGEFHFEFAGGIEEAVYKVKAYLSKRHLKHLHTLPFLIDLDAESEHESLDGLDIHPAANIA